MARECFLHCSDEDISSNLVDFSDARWDTTITSCARWINFDDVEQLIARKLLDLESKPENACFHYQCYLRFNCKRRMDQAQRRFEKKKADGENVESVSKTARPHRRQTDTVARRNDHILPDICILCRANKWKQENSSGKWVPRKLHQGGPNAEAFYEAVVKLKRDDVLRDILYRKDLLAVEAKYHNKCYRKLLHAAAKLPTAPAPSAGNCDIPISQRRLHRAFQAFCVDVVDVMRRDGKIVNMKKLTRLFRQKCEEEEDIVLSAAYKTTYLKSRLQAVYPDLVFAKQRENNKPQVVFFSSAGKNIVVSSNDVHDNSDESDDSDTDSAAENEEGPSKEYDTSTAETSATGTCNEEYGGQQTQQDVSSEHEDVSSEHEGSTGDKEQVHSYSTRQRKPSPGPTNSQNQGLTQDDWRHLYFSALSVRNTVKVAPKFSSWPPTPDDMTEDKLFNIVPAELFNLLAWVCNLTSDFNQSHVKVSDDAKRKLLSISQDIISLTNKKQLTPKHIMVGVAVRHITGSQRLVNILNGLGHCISQTTLQRLDTEIAESEKRNHVPSTINRSLYTTLVWDNIDFLEETINGQNTTHVVNGIAIQSGARPMLQETSETDKNCADCKSSGMKSRKRAMENTETNIVHFFKKKRTDPQFVDILSNHDAEENAKKVVMKKDTLYFLLKSLGAVSPNGLPLPSWSGFNSAVQNEVPACSTITYLPVIDGNATDMSTVNTILHRSMDLASHLDQEATVIVADQAIYAKAQEIRWGNEEMLQKTVLRLGEFHTIMAFIAAIGKRFERSGLEDLLLDAGTVAGGSMNAVITGRHYNRALRAHTLLCEALERLRWDSFVETMSENDQEKLRKAGEVVLKDWPEHFEQVLGDAGCECDEFLVRFEEFNAEHCRSNPTFHFWSSYIDMVCIMLRFLRATREGNWNLHLSTVREMLPWFFALDRLNYARYLTAYYHEMINLPNTHPEPFQHLLSGEFSVQRQTAYGFSKVACDKTIEQTVNKDAKSKSGWTGFTLNRSAVCRWIMGNHARGSITQHCERLAGHSRDEQTIRKELEPAVMLKMESMVESLQHSITSHINPFATTTLATGLINITSGLYASDEVSRDMLSAQTVGETQLADFVEQRIAPANKVKSVFDRLQCVKLKTFASAERTSKTAKSTDSLKTSDSLLARLLLISQVETLDLEHIMTFALADVPHALGNADGTLTKTNKSDLMKILVKQVPDLKIPCNNRPKPAALILDGMVLLRQLRGQQIPQTFGQLGETVLECVVRKATAAGAERVDVVFDTYPDNSIKSGEQARRRSAIGVSVFHLTGDKQKVPNNFQQYLSSGKNKESLIRFLFEHWCKNGRLPEDLTLFFAHEGVCNILKTVNAETTCVQHYELSCDHLEADTRMLLHAQSAAASFRSVTICSPDTDVFVLAMSCMHSMDDRCSLLLQTSSDDLYDMMKGKAAFTEETCKALLGFHCFTGSDSTSSFRKKGKTTAFNLLKKHPEFMHSFAELGTDWNPSEQLCRDLETFVCLLYGSESNDINTVRFDLFKKNKSCELKLPPNQDALNLHTMRACYQAAIHRRCCLQRIEAPAPENHGWTVSKETRTLCVKWNSQPAVPPSITDFVKCNCKTGCSGGRCTCRRHSLDCTDLCGCQGCTNIEKTVEQEPDTDIYSDGDEYSNPEDSDPEVEFEE